ncbi:PilC/PilY family type IV pilus protein [Amphritea balenae]|uniref:VWA domain-containing protein n=1 Tax=Amphritea balenae TaxID=452629 RepID=A0A3P1SK29_9GAMM|nr:PilC/PilY family type IV pilus protein [Amphritea balenae]RRC97330.1 VWA domain-containing protein [Amphritea balenae]GGK83531.1 pilus assembly protein PilY [Amphritea balenae]
MFAKRNIITCSSVLLIMFSVPVLSDGWDLNNYPPTTKGLVGEKPNVMLLLDTSGSMNRQVSDTDRTSKFEAAKTAVQALLNDPVIMSQSRLGLSRFQGDNGGSIEASCGSTKKALEGVLNKMSAGGNTPLAETYYEITRYFRGMNGFFALGTQYSSPITHQCQKNYVVVLSDGAPREDMFEGKAINSSIDALAGSNIPNWDKKDNDEAGVVNNYSSFYLDDLALFGAQIDLSDDYKDQQSLSTYTISFGNFSHAAISMMDKAAENGDGISFKSVTSEQLTSGFRDILTDILSRDVIGTSPVSLSAGELRQGLQLFSSSYKEGAWTGELAAYNIDGDESSPTYGQINQTASWQASLKLPSPEERVIITNMSKASAVPFEYDKVKGAINSKNVVRFIRGEELSGTAFRAWGKHKLGDIIHSTAVFVSDENDGMVYIGSNDGMLHGFDARYGVEKLAYVPGSLLSKLPLLTDYKYEHQFYVDATPVIKEVLINDKPRKILVGGLNSGGRSVYALDITKPALFSKKNASDIFLWEFEDSDLGHTFSQPKIVQLNDGRWYAAFGSGYLSAEDGPTTGKGHDFVYLVDIATAEAKKIPIKNGQAGLSTLTSYDSESDGKADFIYGGDLKGNLWRIDVSSSDPDEWNGHGVIKLFQACYKSDADNDCIESSYQPISTAVTITDVNNHRLILFGTGKDFEKNDPEDMSIQSFYGIYDVGTQVAKTSLLQQAIEDETTYTNGDLIREVRISSKKPMQLHHQGWYLDIAYNKEATGERVVTQSIIWRDRVIFPTRIYNPVGDGGYCDEDKYDLDGWLMILDTASGSRINYRYFDTNRDGRVNATDDVLEPDSEGNVDGGLSGIKGIDTGVAILEQPKDDEDDSEEDVDVSLITSTLEQEYMVDKPGTIIKGRKSWQQLR